MSDHHYDDKPERSKFEWRPEDITILNPEDPGYSDGDWDESEDELDHQDETTVTSSVAHSDNEVLPSPRV